jgi:hypothetical protein
LFYGPSGIETNGTADVGNGIHAKCETSGACWAVYGSSLGVALGAITENANGNWGVFSLGDVFVDGACTGCTVAHIVQNSGREVLRPGDLVVASGVKDALPGGRMPMMTVRRAAGESAVVGVVKETLEIEMVNRPEIRREFTDDDPLSLEPGEREFTTTVVDQVVPVHSTVDRPAGFGDFVVIVTDGLAQVNPAQLPHSVRAGEALALGGTAETSPASTAAALPTSLGVALEDSAGRDLIWAFVDIRR